MRERCPDARLLGVASLPDYRLAFTIYSEKRKCGCADILPMEGESVYGLLYKLNDADMEAMDVFEGHPVHYRRIQVVVLSAKGKEVEAETYEVVKKEKDLLPSTHYLGLIKRAANRFGFPETYHSSLSKIEVKTIE